MEMTRLTRDGTAEAVPIDQIITRERGQGNINILCSADHGQDWQPYPVDLYSCYMCDHTYIHKTLSILPVIGKQCQNVYYVGTLAVGTKTRHGIDPTKIHPVQRV